MLIVRWTLAVKILCSKGMCKAYCIHGIRAETLFIMCGVLASMSIVLLRSFFGSVLSREFGDRSFALMCVLKSIFYEEYV